MNKELSHSPLYVYPAVFTPEPEGGYFVHFPDIENCFTCGDTLEEGIMMAEEALALMVYSNYEEALKLPKPAPINEIRQKKFSSLCPACILLNADGSLEPDQ